MHRIPPCPQSRALHGSARAGPTGSPTPWPRLPLLGKHSNTVYGWVRSGALPSERIGNTIYIPKWALARLQAPPPEGDEAA